MSSINKSLGTEKDKPVLATIDKNGEPTCPGGSEVDNNFSIFDKLDPPFTCVSKLKDRPDLDDMLNKVNQQDSNLTNNFVTNRIRETTPAAGGKRRKTKKIQLRKTKRRIFKRRKHTRRR
jgi:hypothetical protein